MSHYTNEFGGILIGTYSDSGKVVNINETCVPTKFQSSKFLFKRYVKNLNKRIKKLYYDSNGDVIYVGEWHSHPNGSSHYSQKDLNSISEIASDSKVKISSPLLLIISAFENSCTENLYIYHNENIYSYEKVS